MRTSTTFQKSIKSPLECKTGILKPGSNNKKLGYKVTAKQWRGKRIYSLTLVERETCDSSCHHWNDCYGNHMPFAHRFETKGLIETLAKEIPTLLVKHKEGIVVRLHVLGDFYSKDYISFWKDMLSAYPNLSIFGYTGLPLTSTLGSNVGFLNSLYPAQCLIRFSRNEESNAFNAFAADESFEGASFTCPEQTNKVSSCAACGLCWTVEKTVRFLTH